MAYALPWRTFRVASVLGVTRRAPTFQAGGSACLSKPSQAESVRAPRSTSLVGFQLALRHSRQSLTEPPDGNRGIGRNLAVGGSVLVAFAGNWHVAVLEKMRVNDGFEGGFGMVCPLHDTSRWGRLHVRLAEVIILPPIA